MRFGKKHIESLSAIKSLQEATEKGVPELWIKYRLQNVNVGIKKERFVKVLMYRILVRLYANLCRGEWGRTVVVYGQAGSGKTTVCNALIQFSQRQASVLPFGFVSAGKDLKQSLCSLLGVPNTTLDQDVVHLLFQSLSEAYRKRPSCLEEKRLGYFQLADEHLE